MPRSTAMPRARASSTSPHRGLNSYLGKIEATIRLASSLMVRNDSAPGLPLRVREAVLQIYPELHNVTVVTLGDETPQGRGDDLRRAIFPRIAAMHGGRIWAEAARNEGAAFYFVLQPRG